MFGSLGQDKPRQCAPVWAEKKAPQCATIGTTTTVGLISATEAERTGIRIRIIQRWENHCMQSSKQNPCNPHGEKCVILQFRVLL